VRFADTLLRRGHLSEDAIAEAYLTGNRPGHLDRCDICAERALELSRWLDDVRDVGVTSADDAFPAERLAAQQTQIMRRLEQMERPARVIAFPSQSRYGQLESGARGTNRGWIAVAAAAGLVIGVFGSPTIQRFTSTPTPNVVTPARIETPAAEPVQTAYEVPSATLWELDTDISGRTAIPSVAALEGMTPSIIRASNHAVLTRGGGR